MSNKVKVTIPVFVARNGEIRSGFFYRLADGQTEVENRNAIECFSPQGYEQGWVTVNLNAEIDIDGIFERLEINAPVEETE